MAKKTKKRKTSRAKTNRTKTTSKDRGLNDIYAMVLFASAFLILIFVFTSATGVIGNYINIGLQYGFGIGRFLAPLFLVAMGTYYLASKSKRYTHFAVGLAIIFASTLALIHTDVSLASMFKTAALKSNGGLLGGLLAYSFNYLLGVNASITIFAFALLSGAFLLSNKTLPDLWRAAKSRFALAKNKMEEKKPVTEKMTQKVEELKRASVRTKSVEPEYDFEPSVKDKTVEETIEVKGPEENKDYELPPQSIFATTNKEKSASQKNVKENIKVLEKTLADFDVDASISRVVTGPTVTRYEIQLASGVKVNRILSLADDIALAFASPDVRILAPIPGKSAIGIEVPNSHRELVTIGDILRSEKMQKAKSLMSIVIGKDIADEPIIADLADMPHLLIAGATGSGKSVCINSIIASLISRATPDQLKAIFIDPKRVELSLFNDIPHLLTPVVTKPKLATNVLEWAVGEMESRYETLASSGVKNISSYNALMQKTGGDKMPFIVIVIDELADLMMVAAREVEDSICRLAQLARAIGIHLVIATQRPSTDVITGLIKANITHRIAFAVSSSIDSRVVLDGGGAEKLIGKGDMLLSTPKTIKPKRLQAAFITEKEIENLCNHLKNQEHTNYVSDIIAPKKSEISVNDFEDELYDQAVELVVNAEKASVSYLQRRLRIGYGRAARLMDMLEDKVIVGPQEGAKPREVLLTREELTSIGAESEES